MLLIRAACSTVLPIQPRHLSNYAQTMVDYTDQARYHWQDGAVIDLQHEMIALTMRIVGKVLFDTEFLSEADEMGAAVNTLLNYDKYLLSSIFPLPLNALLPGISKARQAQELVTGRLQSMIAERRASDLTDKFDLLSMLVKTRDDQGQAMSDRQIQDEAVTFFIAGHETTALALAWTFYLLVTNSVCYARAQEEVDRALRGKLPVYSDLARLPYSLMAVKETMRLYPSTAAVARQALRPVNIKGYQLQKNDLVIISTSTVPRQPQ